MSLVLSLLHAIVRLDGEAVVMHVGDRPYVVTPNGHVDLATRGLALDAVNGIVTHVLTPEAQHAFQEFGATQCELAPLPDFPQEQFTMVVARNGDDVWAEIRRRRLLTATGPVMTPDAAVIVHPAPSFDAAPAELAVQPAANPALAATIRSGEFAPPVELLGVAEQFEPSEPIEPAILASASAGRPHPPVPSRPVPPPPPMPAPPVVSSAPVVTPAPEAEPVLAAPTTVGAPAVPSRLDDGSLAPIQSPGETVAGRGERAPVFNAPPSVPEPRVGPVGVDREAPTPSQPAVVLPLSRSPIRPDAPRPIAEDALAGLDRLLRLAAARGASTLYLSSSARPSVRVDGDIQVLDGAPILGPNDVESLLLTLMPERNAEALRTGMASEWICDVPDVGRVRCLSFRDHRGPGGVFRIMPTRSVTVDQLGLSREIQGLANEPEGLVLVSGPRSSGKRTLISSLVDFINRTRRDHVITVESEINIVHERGASFISQREVRGGSDEMLRVAETALREDPDVLVLEEVRAAALMDLALDAAASGHLVIVGLPAHTASGAVDRIIDLYQPESRRQVQLSLAQHLRGVVAQVLLRKSGGGRLAAREVLLNTPAVASVLAEGKTSQLPLAIEGGRKHGMVPLNDALVGFVQSGAVDVREAYRQASDRPGLLSLLRRQGIDTSGLERLA
jgi:twitching motility protein PilT